MWHFSSKVMCFLNGQLIGDDKDLGTWAEKQWNFKLSGPNTLYLAITKDYYLKHLNDTGAMFELFSDVCPKTCKNFQNLCTGERGLSPNGLMLCYKGSLLHRVMLNGWIQGGGMALSFM
ncbi:hypothetical protein CRUP_023969 [Coryphaenoides rupestris]|nr:hypothetical protein CRUP_023969 [Coryphaenoides rupestris]